MITALKIVFYLLILATRVPAVYAEFPREQLKQMVEQFQKNPTDNALREKIIKLAQTIKPAPAIQEEVERRMVRGIAAFESAKNIDDYESAISEFQAANIAAPWFSNAYFNLGVANEKAGNFKEAMENWRFYLLTITDKKETTDIKQRIYKLEYAIDRSAKDFNTYTSPNGDFKVSIPRTWKVESESYYADDIRRGKYASYIFSDKTNPFQKFIIINYLRYTAYKWLDGRLEMYAGLEDYTRQRTKEPIEIGYISSESDSHTVYAHVEQPPLQKNFGDRSFMTFTITKPEKMTGDKCRAPMIELCDAGEYKFFITEYSLDVGGGFYVLISFKAASIDQNNASYYKEIVRSFSPLKQKD
jgi:tetratricopeptide (TPR) repeat protein